MKSPPAFHRPLFGTHVFIRDDQSPDGEYTGSAAFSCLASILLPIK
jgi:hypothetical protein